jgi:hypothetical protein
MSDELDEIESPMIDLGDMPMAQVMALNRSNGQLAGAIRRIIEDAGRDLRSTVAPFQSSLTTDR